MAVSIVRRGGRGLAGFALAFALAGPCCAASSAPLFDTLSPKLKQLVQSHAEARSALDQAAADAARSNSVEVTYFYDPQGAKPRAAHFYPHVVGRADVVLSIRENQQPWDEFAGIVFELLNSKNKSRFEQVFAAARSGALAKPDFPRAIMRLEFEAVQSMRALLGRMELSEQEKAGSYYYARFLSCPAEFEEFFAFATQVATQRDALKHYEAAYDELRGK